MNTITLKPSPGRRVRHPDRGGALLAPEGEQVADTSYWRRRLRDGDVERIDDQPRGKK